MGQENYYFQLGQIDFFKIHPNLIPFVGEDYDDFKILQIGESHYLNQRWDDMKVHVDDFLVDWWKEPCNRLLADSVGWVDTRGVLDNFINGKSGSYTIFSNVLRSFCHIVLSEKEPHIVGAAKKKYNYFAFMNFFQMPSLIEGVKFWDSLDVAHNVNAGQLWDICVERSSQVLDAVVEILDPTMIVFTSISAGEAYAGKYKDDLRVIYTSHPQAPFSWNKGLARFQGKTGQEVFEEALEKFYNKTKVENDGRKIEADIVLYQNGFKGISGGA